MVLAFGGVTCVHMSVKNCPWAGEGWGGGEELPLLIENYMDHGSWNVSHAQTEIQRPHTEAIFTKIMDNDIGLALHRDLYALLSITISRDRFNVKKHRALYLYFSKGLR
jgi:hypothetical protein